MSAKSKTSAESTSHYHERQTTYEIGDRKVLITCVFRDDDAQTLDEILLKLMKKEFKNS